MECLLLEIFFPRRSSAASVKSPDNGIRAICKPSRGRPFERFIDFGKICQMIDKSHQRRLVSKGRSERILGDGGSDEGDAISDSETGPLHNPAISIPIKLSGFL
jgi:hypothetical protein